MKLFKICMACGINASAVMLPFSQSDVLTCNTDSNPLPVGRQRAANSGALSLTNSVNAGTAKAAAKCCPAES